MHIKKILIGTAALAGSIATAAAADAATYQYVDQSGMLRLVEAGTPTQAIAIAPNIMANSGVILVGGVGGEYIDPTANGGMQEYQYVDINGRVQTIMAVSAEAALLLATNRADHSGVIRTTAMTEIPDNMVVTVYNQ